MRIDEKIVGRVVVDLECELFDEWKYLEHVQKILAMLAKDDGKCRPESLEWV